jgi:protein SCO1/2
MNDFVHSVPATGLTRRRCLGLAAAAASALCLPARAHQHHDVAPGTRRSVADYALPDATLVRDDGRRVSLAGEMNDGRLVMLNFVFTTCTAICPVTSQVFAETQARLGSQLGRVHMMSISIDPENDTPAQLREYAKRFGAGAQWQHYTGSHASSVTVQKAFATYRGDKMNHQPVTLLRRAAGQPWVRLEGFVAPSELAAEAKALLGAG